MRRLTLATVVLALSAGPALADPKPSEAKPSETKAAEPCKRRVVGKGLERKVVCDLGDIVLKSEPPKPSVLIVPRDGKNVVGRPKQTDPLKGLSPRLR